MGPRKKVRGRHTQGEDQVRTGAGTGARLPPAEGRRAARQPPEAARGQKGTCRTLTSERWHTCADATQSVVLCHRKLTQLASVRARRAPGSLAPGLPAVLLLPSQLALPILFSCGGGSQGPCSQQPLPAYPWNLLGCLFLSFPGSSDGKQSDCKAGDPGSIPGSGRYPGGGNGNPLQHLAWRIPWTEESDGLQSMESQRVGHN